MKVGLIDSGINIDKYQNVCINQYAIIDDIITKVKPKDYIGHGTVVFEIINNSLDEYKKEMQYIMVCPNVDKQHEIEDTITAINLAKAIDFLVEQKCDVINISMGTEDFYNRDLVEKACTNAFKKNVIIVCACPYYEVYTMPWVCKDVIKVREADTDSIYISKEKNYSEIIAPYKPYEERNDNFIRYVSGTSFACATITADICKKIMKKENIDIYTTAYKRARVKVINKRFKVRKNKLDLKKVVIVSFSKEMHGIIREKNNLSYKVVGVVDSPKKGTINIDVGSLIKEEEYGVKITSKIENIESDYDTLIIGYLKELENRDKYFNIDNLLEINFNNRKANVYSLVPIEKKWIDRYKEEGIGVEIAPVINKNELRRIRKAIPNVYFSIKPVIGVFGTNGEGGKFTLQLKLRRMLESKGIKVFHLSTEHQAYLLDADAVYPDGYENDKNVSLSMEEKVEYIERLMVHAELNSDSDMTLVGAQGSIIPPELYYWSFLKNASFLEATKPDLNVLVVNPIEDPDDYIRDSISTLKAAFKCETIALAFADSVRQKNKYGFYYRKKYNEKEQEEMAKKLEKKYGIMSGCIMNESFVEQIATRIIDICS